MRKTYTLIDTLYEPPSVTKNTTTPKEVWTNKLSKEVENCGVCNGESSVVELSLLAFAKVEILLRKFPDTEWLAYLKGRKVKTAYCIRDLLIPRQQRSAATVDLDEEQILNMEGVVGTIHSHHMMGAFFSSTDDSYIAPNHPVSIVVSTSSWACKTKQILPCGNFTIAPATLVLPQKLKMDLEAFSQNIADNITQKVLTPATYISTGWKGFICTSCGRNFKEYTRVVWVSGVCFCKDCADAKKDKENAGKNEVGVVKCEWCQRFVRVKDTLTLNESIICQECFEDSRVIGLG